MRLGLKIISGDFEEDLTKIVGVEAFQRFLIKPEIAGNLYNRKLISFLKIGLTVQKLHNRILILTTVCPVQPLKFSRKAAKQKVK